MVNVNTNAVSLLAAGGFDSLLKKLDNPDFLASLSASATAQAEGIAADNAKSSLAGASVTAGVTLDVDTQLATQAAEAAAQNAASANHDKIMAEDNSKVAYDTARAAEEAKDVDRRKDGTRYANEAQDSYEAYLQEQRELVRQRGHQAIAETATVTQNPDGSSTVTFDVQSQQQADDLKNFFNQMEADFKKNNEYSVEDIEFLKERGLLQRGSDGITYEFKDSPYLDAEARDTILRQINEVQDSILESSESKDLKVVDMGLEDINLASLGSVFSAVEEVETAADLPTSQNVQDARDPSTRGPSVTG